MLRARRHAATLRRALQSLKFYPAAPGRGSKLLRAILAKYHGVPADIPLRVVHDAAIQVKRERPTA
jgi:hypothetical protein